MEWSDEAAAARAKAGDADAFRVLVERHSRPLFRLAFRMTGNEQDAEDIVQDTFLRAYRRIEKFDERASFGTWLYRITVNCSLDLVRARKRRSEQSGPTNPEMGDLIQSLPASSPTPDRMAMSGEAKQRIAEAMEELSASERTAFVLRHFEGHSIGEIASVLKIKDEAVKNTVFRAVKKMRTELEPLITAGRMQGGAR